MEEVVLQGDQFWQITVVLKGTKRICYPLGEYLERKPKLAALWQEHIVDVLEAEGFQVEAVPKGLAEYESIRKIFVKHALDVS